MIRRFLAMGFVLSLVACGSSRQTASSGTGTMPAVLVAGLRSVQPDGQFCSGTHGVSVTPCPIRLMRKTRKTGIVVTVVGAGVVSASVAPGECGAGSTNGCNATPITATKFQITSGSACVTNELTFSAYKTSNQLIGYGYLRVFNRYCPA